MSESCTVRVALPHHLRLLARSGAEVVIQVRGTATISTVLDALEGSYPMLRGTIRDQVTGNRRAFLRYFVCGADVSHESGEWALPDPVTSGAEPFMVIGAISGG